MMIELDVSAPWEAPEPPIGRRHPPRRLVAGLLLAAVLLLTGGARAAGTIEPLYSIRGNASVTMLSGDRLFVVQDGGHGDNHLTAYRIADGAVLWTELVGVSGRDLLYADDRVVLTIEEGSGQEALTIAGHAAATGKMLWQRTGFAVDQVVGRVLVTEDLENTDGRRRTYGISVDTGETRWTSDVADGVLQSFLYRDQDFVVGLYAFAKLTPDRVLRVYDPRTGAVVSTVRLADGTRGEPIEKFDIVNGVVLAYLPDGAVSGFDAATGAYRWLLPGNSDDYVLIPCGTVICQGQNPVITGVDPVTGHPLWTIDQWHWLSPFDEKHVVVNRLSGDLQPLAGGAVFDVTDGAVTRQLGSWRALGPSGGRLLVWRPDPTSRDGDALVGILDPTSAAVAVVAHASGWYSQPHCLLSGRHLACNDRSTVAVWRMS